MRSAYDVIIKPVISEQSMDMAQEQKQAWQDSLKRSTLSRLL